MFCTTDNGKRLVKTYVLRMSLYRCGLFSLPSRTYWKRFLTKQLSNKYLILQLEKPGGGRSFFGGNTEEAKQDKLEKVDASIEEVSGNLFHQHPSSPYITHTK